MHPAAGRRSRHPSRQRGHKRDRRDGGSERRPLTRDWSGDHQPLSTRKVSRIVLASVPSGVSTRKKAPVPSSSRIPRSKRVVAFLAVGDLPREQYGLPSTRDVDILLRGLRPVAAGLLGELPTQGQGAVETSVHVVQRVSEAVGFAFPTMSGAFATTTMPPDFPTDRVSTFQLAG